ncbi:hypothetical protein [Roseovarius indicus]|uniref:Uncharacterized protein n=1 Tax=Roseovarius indicus TaxID=540747 RepID=A0A0T5P8H7_9RHOB|nr:hypothetical protein [Roseovarius indicus]KRS17657.1 hypothetical protein XM52_11615 [Roseovarius indicus]QEW24600.1 hypothetical protein RIdsm_00381 [Roseovarius indicus]SFE26656.1 hypothetical protein SAMN04488031_107172 [Roseovarius indicus]
MIRKLILLLLSLGFIAGGIAFALTEMNLASSTADQNHIYAALFGGGLLGFAGVVLFILAFRKPKPAEPEGAAAGILAMGMSTVPDDGGDEYSD